MTREDVFDEFGIAFPIRYEYVLANEIVRLRAQLTRMACPVCHEINPAEVHTCTPAPKVTVLDEWRVFDRAGACVLDALDTRDSALYYAASLDIKREHDAPHTVRRVALLDEPTTETA